MVKAKTTPPSAPTDPGAAGAAARAVRVALARQHPGAFAELCIRDEKSGLPLVLCEMHREWLQLIRQHSRVAIVAHIESGKTSLLAVAYLIWLLGSDPTTRIALVGSTFAQASKVLALARRMIEKPSPELAAVFPLLRPGRGVPWRDDCFTIERPSASKDPSAIACGRGGTGSIIGSRVDHMVVDDIVDFENARTETQRQAVADWFRSSEVSGRLVENGRIVVVGTAWHNEDLLSRLAESPGWVARRYSIEDEDGSPRWPERWSPARIAAKRRELGVFESSRQLDVLPVSDADQRLRVEWIDQALSRGRNLPLPAGARPHGEVGVVVVGVDLAVSLKSSADETAIVAAMVRPDETRELIEIAAGRWEAPTIVAKIADIARRNDARVVVVESVAAQAFLLPYLARERIAVEGFTTGTGKMSLLFAVETLATELARSMWIFPSNNDGRPAHPEVRKLVREMVSYSPSSHTGDRLAALLMAGHAARAWGSPRMPLLRSGLGLNVR